MSDVIEIAVEPRERAGKGASRALRRAGLVPAVIYGGKDAPAMVSIRQNELTRLINRGSFMTSIYDIKVDGKTERVLPRDIQLDPILDHPIHIDFFRLVKGGTIIIEVPVTFVGEEESPGLKRGGVLNVVRHAIELECLNDAIPEGIEISVEGVDIGDSIHISAITLPEGATPTISDRDFTIATLVAPSALKSSEQDDEEEVEGEGEGEAEGEGGDAEENS